MFRLTFISDATSPVSTVLCASTRDLMEHDFTLNATNTTQIEPLLGAANSTGFDRANRRNTLSFSVWRSEEFSSDGTSGDAFTDVSAAIALSLGR